MSTNFILDRKQQEEKETIAEILELTKKRAYPTKETVHLARFVDACFYVIEDVKRKELQKKQEEERKIRLEEEERQRKLIEEEKKKELEALAPTPENSDSELPELPTLNELGLDDVPSPEQFDKREYVLQIYNSQVGVLIEKEENNLYSYKIIEPYIEQSIVQKAKEMYGKEFERDNSLFENSDFIKRVAEKVTNKLGLPYNNLLPQKIKYYLERDILGANVIDPLLYDEKVKAIICDGPNKVIKIEYEDLGQMPTNINISSEELSNFMKRLAQAAGKTLNEKNPILDINFQGLKCEGALGIGGASSKIIVRRIKNDF